MFPPWKRKEVRRRREEEGKEEKKRKPIRRRRRRRSKQEREKKKLHLLSFFFTFLLFFCYCLFPYIFFCFLFFFFIIINFHFCLTMRLCGAGILLAWESQPTVPRARDSTLESNSASSAQQRDLMNECRRERKKSNGLFFLLSEGVSSLLCRLLFSTSSLTNCSFLFLLFCADEHCDFVQRRNLPQPIKVSRSKRLQLVLLHSKRFQFGKSEIFNKPPYEILTKDNIIFFVCHIIYRNRIMKNKLLSLPVHLIPSITFAVFFHWNSDENMIL